MQASWVWLVRGVVAVPCDAATPCSTAWPAGAALPQAKQHATGVTRTVHRAACSQARTKPAGRPTKDAAHTAQQGQALPEQTVWGQRAVLLCCTTPGTDVQTAPGAALHAAAPPPASHCSTAQPATHQHTHVICTAACTQHTVCYDSYQSNACRPTVLRLVNTTVTAAAAAAALSRLSYNGLSESNRKHLLR